MHSLKVYLGDFPFKRFPEQDVQTYITEFREKLREITHQIERRNRHLDIPYTSMLPEKIPSSIAM